MNRPNKIKNIKIHESLGALYSAVSSEEDHSPLYSGSCDKHSDDEYHPVYASSTNILVLPNLNSILKRSLSIATKVEKIKKGTSDKQLKEKKKIKNNTSVKDWWIWYWQAPKARFGFLYFTLVLLSCAPFILYWFMDNDSSFILCGFVSLTTFAYAAHKFRLAINLKKEIDKFTRLNGQLKKENRLFESSLKRILNASHELQQTSARLKTANNRNRKNLKKFKQVESNMSLMGKKAKTNLKQVRKITHEINTKWRDELLNTDRALLHTVFDRYERSNTNKTQHGLTAEDFKEFQDMLPERYQQRFNRMGTFNAYAGDKVMINKDDFVEAIDTFALMETDDNDTEYIITPLAAKSPGLASFKLTSIDSPWRNVKSLSVDQHKVAKQDSKGSVISPSLIYEV